MRKPGNFGTAAAVVTAPASLIAWLATHPALFWPALTGALAGLMAAAGVELAITNARRRSSSGSHGGA